MSMIPNFAAVKRRVSSLGANFSVTHYTLTLGSADPTTGQFIEGYAPSTIDMIIITDFRTQIALGCGVYAPNTCFGYTNTVINEGDRIQHSDGTDYVITSVQAVYAGDKSIYYAAKLTESTPSVTEAVYPWPAPPPESGFTLNVGAAVFDASKIESVIDLSIEEPDVVATITTIIDLQVT